MRSSKRKPDKEAKNKIPLADLIEILRKFEEEKFFITAFLKSNGTDELERVKSSIRDEIDRRQKELL
jgi:hypothetical protein